MRINTDLTKILNPIAKPKPKTSHSFKFHEDLTTSKLPIFNSCCRIGNGRGVMGCCSNEFVKRTK